MRTAGVKLRSAHSAWLEKCTVLLSPAQRLEMAAGCSGTGGSCIGGRVSAILGGDFVGRANAPQSHAGAAALVSIQARDRSDPETVSLLGSSPVRGIDVYGSSCSCAVIEGAPSRSRLLLKPTSSRWREPDKLGSLSLSSSPPSPMLLLSPCTCCLAGTGTAVKF